MIAEFLIRQEVVSAWLLVTSTSASHLTTDRQPLIAAFIDCNKKGSEAASNPELLKIVATTLDVSSPIELSVLGHVNSRDTNLG